MFVRSLAPLKARSVCAALIGVVWLGAAHAQSFDPKANLAEPAQKFIKVENPEVLKTIKRVFIPSFTMHVVTESKISQDLPGIAVAFGGVTGMTITLKGADNDRMQAIADDVYQQTVQNLTIAGFEVIPLERFANNENYKKLVEAGSKTPYVSDSDAGKGLVHSSAGLPAYLMDEVSFIPPPTNFKPRFLRSKDDEVKDLYQPMNRTLLSFSSIGSAMAEQALMRDLDAALLKVRFTVTAGQLTANHDFWKTSDIKTKAAASFPPLVNRFAFITPKGDRARISVKEHVSSAELGEMVNTTTAASQVGDVARNVANVGLSVVLGRGIGFGRERTYEWQVDPKAFEQVTEDYLKGLTDMMVLTAQQHIQGAVKPPAESGAAASTGSAAN